VVVGLGLGVVILAEVVGHCELDVVGPGGTDEPDHPWKGGVSNNDRSDEWKRISIAGTLTPCVSVASARLDAQSRHVQFLYCPVSSDPEPTSRPGRETYLGTHLNALSPGLSA